MPKQTINIGNSPNDGTGDPLRTGGQKINENFTEVYGLLNNRVTGINIAIDWASTTHPLQQIADWVNANGLTVAKDEIKWIVCFKSSPLGSLEQVFYMWLLGAGEWGTAFGNTVGNECAGKISQVSYSDSQINKYDLGEIGTTLISDAVNGSGPYGVTTQQPVYFVVERSGDENVYLYIGNVEGEVGLGEAQTDEGDFVNLTEEPIPPIDPNDFVTNQAFNGSLYDTATYGLTDVIANFDFSAGEKFYIIEADNVPTYYFASKQTNTEDFVGSRIYFPDASKHFDLAQPDLSQDGYDIWDLGNITSNTFGNGLSAFQAWFHVGQIPKEIPIDGSKFRFVKGVTSGSINTGTGIEVNDIAEGGIYDHPIVGAKVFGSLKCIDNTGDLTTGIGTKWEPFGSFTPA